MIRQAGRTAQRNCLWRQCARDLNLLLVPVVQVPEF